MRHELVAAVLVERRGSACRTVPARTARRAAAPAQRRRRASLCRISRRRYRARPRGHAGRSLGCADRSMPASLARRRASGEEKMRLVPLCAGCAFAALAAGAEWLLRRGFGARPCRLRLAGAAACSALRSCAAAWAPRPSRLPPQLHVLAFAGQHRDHRIDRHVLGAFRNDDLGERALVDRLDFHRRLVGLDLGDHVAGLDLVALFLEPLGKIALLHRGRQRRHEDVGRHGPTGNRRPWRPRPLRRPTAAPASRDWPHRASARPCR